MNHLTPSFQLLLLPFANAFTEPAYRLFCSIVAGWILSMRHRYITEVIYASGNVGKMHWSCFHRFFSLHAWSVDKLGLILMRSIISAFTCQGIVTLIVDDTLCRKRGLHLYGAGMHHDPLFSSRALKIVSWGHDWVVLALLIELPSWAPTKYFALPIACRLYRNIQGNVKGKNQDNRSRAGGDSKTKKEKPAGHRTRPELGLELIALVAGWFPHMQFIVVADSLYGGKSVLRKIPSNVDFISRVHPGGVLYEPAKTTGKRGRARKKGKRLSSLADWANDDSPWTLYAFDRFGLHANLHTKTRQGLYYTAGKDRLLTFVLVRDTTGKRPDQIFYCTRLDWDAQKILSTYAGRWAIEVTFENVKQLLGFEDPANWVPKAVLRTAPIALLLYSLVVLWFHQAGHPHVEFPERPWYPKKSEPSFADMLGTLRRLSIAELWQSLVPNQGRLKTFLSWLTEFVTRPG